MKTMQVLALAAVVALACAATAAALAELPHHMRGGEAWRRMQMHAAADAQVARGSAPTGTFPQMLNHSDASAGTFEQRYWVNTTSYDEETGAIILYICGEGPCSGVPAGFVEDLAEEHSAAILVLEHRFYGDSVPGDDFSVANLAHLTVHNALHDLAAFLQWFQQQQTGTHPSLIIGGSYSGALSAWFRITFPDLVKGSLASSGVVNTIYEFWQFDNQVGLSAGAACADVLRATMDELEQGLAAGKDVKGLFGADALSDTDFWYMVADSGAQAVQYGFKADMCTPMLAAQAAGRSLSTTFANFTNTFWGKGFGPNCFYDTNCLKNDPARWQPTSRAWRWQKCTEMAYLQIAPTTGSIRSKSLTIDVLTNQCTEVFGAAAMPQAGSAAMIAEFGGAEPKGTNIFYSNGSDDPWQRAAVSHTLSPTEPEETAHCNGCGHCGDLGIPSPSTPANLRKLRQHIAEYIATWLQE